MITCYLTKHIGLTLVLLISLRTIIYQSIEANPMIDEKHLAKEPDCGEMTNNRGSRISNSERSEILYPWSIKVRRTFLTASGDTKGASCGGNIITRQ